MSIHMSARVRVSDLPDVPPDPGTSWLNLDILGDSRLSIAARGLYCTIASFGPNGVMVGNLAQYTRPAERASIPDIVTELVAADVVRVLA